MRDSASKRTWCALRTYNIAKMFVLAFMFGVYIVFLATIAAAYHAGGWVVVLVDKYQEGLMELVLLSSVLPLASYITFKEIATSYREIRKAKKQHS